LFSFRDSEIGLRCGNKNHREVVDMKVKIFTSSGNVEDLEKEINTWLSSHKVNVGTINQSYTCDAKSCYALVSVWFEDLENITEI
jgi:hypothetical protein